MDYHLKHSLHWLLFQHFIVMICVGDEVAGQVKEIRRLEVTRKHRVVAAFSSYLLKAQTCRGSYSLKAFPFLMTGMI